MPDKRNKLLIRTPEGIVFSQVLAGPMSRFLAWLLDLVCIVALSSLLSTLLGLLGLISIDTARAVTMLVSFALWICYGIALEWKWRGQTIGKKLLRLRVMDAQGLRIQFSQIVIRNLLRAVDMLPIFYLLGGISSLLTRKSQRLGDIAANTVVVRNPPVAEPALEEITGGKYNSLRDYPHLEARLRQKVSPAEAALALQAVLRRDQLEPAARVEVFAQLAEHLRGLVAFPPETTEGITDEQYVRNVVDVVYRAKPRD